MVKSKVEQDIIDALEARAAEHGIDIVDVEVVGATKAPCVRVRLDKLEGDPINLDEVTAQTAWVSETVEALDPISSAYTLEVSSPGMKRPLRRPSDFARFVGEDGTRCRNQARPGSRFCGVHDGELDGAGDDALACAEDLI